MIKKENILKVEDEIETLVYITEKLKEIYPLIIDTLKKYCDLDEKYYNIIALWIMGTYLHRNFSTYPFLYLNAMRGSGKSRLLNLISHLSWNGKSVVSCSESVLFRTAKFSTLCIDEFENVGSKEKGVLRQLLNASYKKGIFVERTKKIKDSEEEKYIVEKFSVYCPIAMANIWGMDNVLSDRCINLTLEKSNNKLITKLIEDFENDENLKMVKQALSEVCVVYTPQINIVYTQWNEYVKMKYDTTLNTLDTLTTYNNNYNNYTNNTNNPENLDNNNINNFYKLFEDIDDISLDSRHLELFFPLFIISFLSDNEEGSVLAETLKTAEKLVLERKGEDVMENRDVSLLDFISTNVENYEGEFISVTNLLKQFKEYVLNEDEDDKYLNTRWLGRALKRLSLVKEKRRLSRGVDVMINIEKAKEKIKLFRDK